MEKLLFIGLVMVAVSNLIACGVISRSVENLVNAVYLKTALDHEMTPQEFMKIVEGE